jgi:hypothetical protein
MSQGSLSEARKAAIDAHLKLITLHEYAAGPIHQVAYEADDNFVPAEPQWLRQGITARLSQTLEAARES